jgi:acetyl esterase/lipase
MTSWQSRAANEFSKLFFRRRSWGDERQLVRRARRSFGVPRLVQRLATRGLEVRRVETEIVRGEWLTPEAAAHGVVLYIHGGGFVGSSAAGHRPVAAGLARLGNFRVFNLDYRLAPEHRFPAALDDVVAAYEWLLAQKIQPTQIALAGDSAGGGLVLSAFLKLRADGLRLPACGVCFSPWADLAVTGESFTSNDKRCVMFHTENIGDFAAVYLGGASALDPLASPVFGEFDDLPPVLLQVGSTELLLDDARRVHEKIQKAGGASCLEIYDDVMHCWQMSERFIPEARRSLEKAAAFIRENINRAEEIG